MKLLVTGTSGFIGTSLCERFAADARYDVVGVDRRAPRETFPEIQYITCDLTDRANVKEVVRQVEPDVIIHLAAQARVHPSLVSASPTYSDNVEPTLNLIESAEILGHRLAQFVYASSETVYGPASAYPCSEDASCNPQSPYAASKAACELLVCRALPEKAIVLRSGMGYGPRSDPNAQVVARFISRALAGMPLLFPEATPPGGHPTRDVNFVGNFLDGLELAIGAQASGTYNIASGRELSILDLANKVVEVVGSGSVQLTREFQYRHGEAGLRTWLDISKARNTLGYAPHMGLLEGLETTVKWYRANPNYSSSNSEAALPLSADLSKGTP